MQTSSLCVLRTIHPCLVVLLLPLGLGSLVGCGGGTRPDRVPVSGRVTIDGEPLTFGSIRFIAEGPGRPAMTKIDANGRFDFGAEGVVVGKNRVEVMADEQLNETDTRWHAPQKYTSYETSDLAVDVTEPMDDLVLELTWAGGKPFTATSSVTGESKRGIGTR